MSDDPVTRLAFQLGMLHAQVDEAARLVAIYSHPAARAKPLCAWSLLPFGLAMNDVLDALSQMHEEPGAEPDFYRRQLSFLHKRHAAAVALKTNWEKNHEQRH